MKNPQEIIVALAGNPNSGKTSLLNKLTGLNQKVGNWPGVTVEKFEGIVNYQGYKIRIIDLPGTYSLTAYSPEEIIARDFIILENPDVVVNVVDGTNLERNLYLTTQLMELETNLVIALNMADGVEKQKIKINFNLLEKLFGSHIIPVSAVKKTGLDNLLDHIIKVYLGEIIIAKNKLNFRPELEEEINKISEFIKNNEENKKELAKYNPRWLAIKLLENDREIFSLVKSFSNAAKENREVLIAEDREAFIRGAIQEAVIFSEKKQKSLTEYLDAIILNRFLGLPIFLFIMWLIFQFAFRLADMPMSWIENLFAWFGRGAANFLPVGIWQSIIVDGIIGGVGGVLIFLPQIVLLFMAISFLEGVGYMARAAFVVDKIMHKAGLHGKSFLPMITGFGCSVPAIMATRTLKNKGDRIATMMIIPFMSCSAKLPVHVLLIAAFFSADMAGNILFGVYFFGILIAVLTARLLKSTILKGESEPFVMELPPYRLPGIKSIFIQAKNRAKMYLKKAGTVILLASILIWGLSNFPKSAIINAEFNQKIAAAENNQILIQSLKQQNSSAQLEYSFAGKIGKVIEPILKPLGYDWKIGIALTAGLAAKEIVVSTLGTIYALDDASDSAGLAQELRADPHFNPAVALSLIVFVLLYVPCIATMTIFLKESGSWKWLSIYFVYTNAIAWIMAFLVYRLALFFHL